MKTTKRKNKLKEFIAEQNEVDGLLPSTHITQAYHLESILDSGSLIPQRCPVIDEDLTYAFYGRPSYRARKGRSSSLQFDLPIVFVLDTEKLSSIHRIFPFDTGAFSYGLYQDFFHKDSAIGDYELAPTLETLKKLVRAFYITNANYMVGSVNSNYPPTVMEFEVDGLREMAKCPGHPASKDTRDDRSTAIEIQLNQELVLKDCLVAVVLPALFLDHQETKQAIRKWGVKNIQTYNSVQNTDPEYMAGQIYQIVNSIYETSGIL